VKALGITHNNKFMLVGDEEGAIKYFDSNYKEVRVPIRTLRISVSWNYLGSKTISRSLRRRERDIVRENILYPSNKLDRFAPTDAKFVTANDKDKTLRIWDLENGVIDKSMSKYREIIYFYHEKFMEMIFIVVNGILIMDWLLQEVKTQQ